MDLYSLFSIVGDIEAEIMKDLEEQTDELQQIFVNVQSAMTVDGKDNFVAEAMRDTYDACVLLSSKSFGKPGIPDKAALRSNRRRLLEKQNTPRTQCVETISQKLSGKGEESGLSTFYKQAERNLRIRLQGWETVTQEVIKAGCEKITRDFDERYQQEEEGEVRKARPNSCGEASGGCSGSHELLGWRAYGLY